MRYQPEIKWSSKSWVHNIFRFYELIFGRKFGIRKESSVSIYKDKVVYEFYTVETVLAHFETLVRQFFEIKWLEVRVTELRLATSDGLNIPWISFAIAVDATSNIGGTSGNHTCTGSNLVLWGCADNLDGLTDNVTGITYNSVSLSFVNKLNQVGNCTCYLFALANPTTGTNTLSLSASSTYNGFLMGVSYSGCSSSLPDNSGTNSVSGATSLAVSLTTIADNCWTILCGGNSTSALGPGTGSTTRVNNLTSNAGVFDSNGALPSGITSMTITSVSPAGILGVMASFAPFGASTGKKNLTLLRTG